MLTTGTVSLSLADVDALRDKIKEKEPLIKEKDSQIEKLKAESKQVLIVEEQSCYGFNEWDLNRVLMQYTHHTFGRGSTYPATSNLSRDLLGCLVPGKPYRKQEYFKNLDDVQKDIRDKLELEYQEEIRVAKAEARRVSDRVKEVQEGLEKEFKESQKLYLDKIEGLQDKIKEWEKSYKELEEGKKELSKIEELEEKIVGLCKELAIEKSKKWYEKLFS